MTDSKRVFILGAGFSRPAGMPLATDLLPLLIKQLEQDGMSDEMRAWLNGLCERLAWLSRDDCQQSPFKLNIEELFHYAHFDIEAFRLKEHLVPVRGGSERGTPREQAELVTGWLIRLEEALRDVILDSEDKSNLAHIDRWAGTVNPCDAVLTFNYDTLVERALTNRKMPWNHGMELDTHKGVPVYKLHGSIDWIVADRHERFSKLALLFERKTANESPERPGDVEEGALPLPSQETPRHIEDDCRLWRCQTREQLREWIKHGQHLQMIPEGAWERRVGVAGLGTYKPLHQLPGLGHVWMNGIRSLRQADRAIVVGFSMSDFDGMAKMAFAEAARIRTQQNRPLAVTVVNPYLDDVAKGRFRCVFGNVAFEKEPHEHIDWSRLG